MRIRFLTWLFIVVERFRKTSWSRSMMPVAISVSETIVTWRHFFRYSATVSHDTQCSCDAEALKDWVDIMLRVYSVAELRSMAWGSSCDCLNAELHRGMAFALKTSGAETCPALSRFLFKILTPVPAWPSILWVLFRMVRTEEQQPVPTFLSILRDDEYRDFFIWDYEDEDTLASSQLVFENGSLSLDWVRYLSEINSQAWAMISLMTRVYSRDRVDHDAPLRLCGFTLMLSDSLDVPQTIAEAFDIELTLDPWDELADIIRAKPRHSLISHDRSEQFWPLSELDSRSKLVAKERCFEIWNTSAYTRLERMHLIWFILNHHETLQPLFAFYPATRCSSLHDAWNLFPHLKNNKDSSFLSFRADFDEFLDCLENAINYTKDKPTIVAHLWATDLHRHAVECLIYLTARLVNSLQNPDGYEAFLKHRGSNAQRRLDLFQDLLDLELFSAIRPMLFKAMCRLSRASKLYPRCFKMSGVEKIGNQLDGGGYGDIWKGLVGRQSVCIKILRIFEDRDIALALKEFGAEALIWRQLYHANVLPFLGLYYLKRRLCLVSPWMDNGNIKKYLQNNSIDTQKRFSMVLDVASGLEYLHNQNIIHGDLKGINILVTPSERACIADFGLSIIVNAMTLRLTTSTTANHRGTMRYNAPELFRLGDTGVKTFASDIYAFGCVGYEIMTSQIPFRELSHEAQIILCVLDGRRPERLPSCTGSPALDCFWELLEMCWDGEQQKRPKADEITKRLIQAPIAAATTPMQFADWDDQVTARFRRSITVRPLLPSVNELEHMLFGEEVAKECTKCSAHLEQSHSEQAAENNSNRIASSESFSSPPDSLSTRERAKRAWEEISNSEEESNGEVHETKRAKPT
ncbi:kinase domain-containing protein [Favolaschia claudopus]|uniref:Kinase domain-containing protein n=1 Tax=Favolaschia claudopus TaxID=2862362 RepID=A0AAW0BKY3_9AGAR